MILALSKAADRDLVSILHYSTQAHGWPAARAYARDLQTTMERLTLYSQLGAARTELGPDLRSFPCREHVIFYPRPQRQS